MVVSSRCWCCIAERLFFTASCIVIYHLIATIERRAMSSRVVKYPHQSPEIKSRMRT